MLKLFRRYCFLFFASVLPLQVPAQQPVYTNYTVENGLPSNEVYDVFEDSLGFIWFATDYGISRFDGYHFTNYSTGDGLVHNTVFGFFEDNHHRVWMRTFNSALCYMENGKIHPYRHNDSLQRFLGRNFIQNFAIDTAGDLWFMSIRMPLGLYRQDHLSGKIERIRLQPGYNAFIRELGGGVTIAGMDLDNGWNETQTANDDVIYSDHTWEFRLGQAETIYGRQLVRSCRLGEQNYLFSYENQFVEIRNGKIEHREIFPQSNLIGQLRLNRDGSCWLSARGLVRYDPGNKTLQTFYAGELINCAVSDRHGNCWIATSNKGLFFIPDIGILRQEQLSEDAGELVTARLYGNRLFLLNKSSALYAITLNSEGPDSVFQRFGTLPGNSTIHGMFADTATGSLFLGGLELKEAELFLKKKLSQTAVHSHGNAALDFIRCLNVYDDVILAGSNSGWTVMNRNYENIYNSKTKDGFTKFCTAVCKDEKGVCWVGTTDGLYFLQNGHTVAFRSGDSLFRQRVSDIGRMPGGGLAVSLRGAGLVVIDRGNVYNLREQNGLTTDLCGKLMVEDSIIWLCSNKGLNRVAIKRVSGKLSFSVTRITVFNGLPSNMVNDVTRYQKQLFLATGRGLAWFDVSKMKVNRHVPDIYIESVLVNEHQLARGDDLAYNENNLAFGFIGLLYNCHGQVHYRYRLEGYETDWHYTTERLVRYFNLPAGNYRFVVSAMNENEMWNETPAAFSFTIPLHFSKTWWFRTLVISAIVLLAFLLIRYYLNQRREKERITSDLLLAELKTLRSQMKPHFIFNSLNSIQHFILEHDEESAHLYLSRFSSLMRKILDNTRLNTINLSREIETLRLYLDLEKLRFGENFVYEISVSPEIITDAIEIPPMLIQPYAENAIWHGLLMQKDKAPRLLLKFFIEKEMLCCVIEDNGIGREKAAGNKKDQSHQSTGMKNIEERIDILNRVSSAQIKIRIDDLYDASGAAAGTRITLQIPLNDKLN